MSRARDFANLAGAADAGTLSGDSLIINGDMSIWQRGTTIDTIANGGYLCDRWRIAHSGLDGNVDVDRSTDVPSGQGFKYSQKISTDAAEDSLDAADQLNLQQRFEGQNLQHILKGTPSAKSLTLSFWVKSSVASTYSVNLRDNDNTRIIGGTYVINTADTWEKKTITFAGDTSGTLDDDNDRSLDLAFYIDAGSDRTDGTFATSWAAQSDDERVYDTTGWLENTSSREWYITGVKLEVGSTATPFKHESYAENLNKCHRYYVQRYPGNQAIIATAMAYGASAAYCELDFPVEMRAVPSVTFTSTASHWEFRNRGTADRTNSGAPGGAAASKWSCRIDMALASSTTDGAAGWIEANNANAYYYINAEL